MLIFGGPVLHTILLDLFQRVWSEGQVFAAWRDALVVPVPQKGNLTMCNNWRGISLLDDVRKITDTHGCGPVWKKLQVHQQDSPP